MIDWFIYLCFFFALLFSSVFRSGFARSKFSLCLVVLVNFDLVEFINLWNVELVRYLRKIWLKCVYLYWFWCFWGQFWSIFPVRWWMTSLLCCFLFLLLKWNLCWHMVEILAEIVVSSFLERENIWRIVLSYCIIYC